MRKLISFVFGLLMTASYVWAQDVTISSQADWDTFATNVNNGTTYSGQTVRLANDISVFTMVGTDVHPFEGTFLGQGHTLTVNISTTMDAAAPFRFIHNATIEHLTVEGSVTCSNTSTGNHASGLVGGCRTGETNLIRNCIVHANVTAVDYAGGIVGHSGNNTTLTMENCIYDGTISGFNKWAGGLVGWGDTITVNLRNCLVKGSFSPGSGGVYHPIGCKYYKRPATTTATACYYLNTIVPTATGDYVLISDAYCTPVDTEPWTVNAGVFDGVAYYAPASSGENYLPGDMNGDHKYTKTDIPILVDFILGQDYYECVDLGLPSRTLWAKTNVGTAFSSNPGSFFAWGETSWKTRYGVDNYKWYSGTENALTKYCHVSSAGYNGYTDTLTELLPEDDAATVNWGTNWCTPTAEQWNELLFCCNWTWSSGSPVGYTVMGPSGNTIFLPATGYHVGDVLLNDDSSENPYGAYWSRTLDPNYTRCARAQIFSSDNTFVYSYPSRDYGLAIRPVRR